MQRLVLTLQGVFEYINKSVGEEIWCAPVIVTSLLLSHRIQAFHFKYALKLVSHLNTICLLACFGGENSIEETMLLKMFFMLL